MFDDYTTLVISLRFHLHRRTSSSFRHKIASLRWKKIYHNRRLDHKITSVFKTRIIVGVFETLLFKCQPVLRIFAALKHPRSVFWNFKSHYLNPTLLFQGKEGRLLLTLDKKTENTLVLNHYSLVDLEYLAARFVVLYGAKNCVKVMQNKYKSLHLWNCVNVVLNVIRVVVLFVFSSGLWNLMFK